MKTAAELVFELWQTPSLTDMQAMVEARDRDVRAAALREAEVIARSYTDGIATRVAVSVAQGIGDRLSGAAERAERGE